jgi:hypothetical protein
MTEQNKEMLMRGDTQPTFDMSFDQEAADDFNILLERTEITEAKIGKILQEEIDKEIINMLISSYKASIKEQYDKAMEVITPKKTEDYPE